MDIISLLQTIPELSSITLSEWKSIIVLNYNSNINHYNVMNGHLFIKNNNIISLKIHIYNEILTYIIVNNIKIGDKLFANINCKQFKKKYLPFNNNYNTVKTIEELSSSFQKNLNL